MYDVLNCFSLIRNINAIFDTKVSSSDLNCLHGIRVLTMFWIIFIHFGRTASLLSFPIGNIDYIVTSLCSTVAGGVRWLKEQTESRDGTESN